MHTLYPVNHLIKTTPESTLWLHFVSFKLQHQLLRNLKCYQLHFIWPPLYQIFSKELRHHLNHFQDALTWLYWVYLHIVAFYVQDFDLYIYLEDSGCPKTIRALNILSPPEALTEVHLHGRFSSPFMKTYTVEWVLQVQLPKVTVALTSP